MSIQTKQIILRDSLSGPLKNFLSKTFTGLGNELNMVADQMYTYSDGKRGIDDKDSINDVFALIERSYVGLYNNAIIRAFPTAATLQEFSVYDMNKSSGRADLLVTHAIAGGKIINLLIEAKSGVATAIDYPDEYTKNYYDSLYNQAFKYYLAEKEYYSGGENYIVTISFDWIRQHWLLSEFLNNDYLDTVTDFYYIYHTSDAGLSVYGNISGPLT